MSSSTFQSARLSRKANTRGGAIRKRESSLRLRQATVLGVAGGPPRPAGFVRYLAPLKDAEWYVYAKPPFAGPQQVLDYVGRYTHRVAISNHRLLDIEDGHVRFHWKDYRDNNQQKTMDLSAEEFIRRFLLHVLPDGFQRIRYYGFLGNRFRKQKLVQCRQLLGMCTSDSNPVVPEEPMDYRDRFEELTGISLRQCPVCHQGRMLEVELLPAVAPPFRDTS